MKKLMKSLPIVAKVLGDKYGVRVEVGGDRACTDGNTIHLPTLPDDDRKAEILARGYIDHEAAHVRFKSGLLSGSALQRALQNILEDIRIESRMKERYRGCGGNLNRMIDELVADGSFQSVSDDAHPGAVLQAFLLHRLRHDVLGQKALDKLADQSEARFREVFSQGKATRIAALGYQADSCASIDEIKALADRILESLQEPDEPEQPDQSDSSTGDFSDDPADDSQSDQDSGQPQGDDSTDSDEDADPDQAGSSEDDAGSDADPNGDDGDSDESQDSSQGGGAGNDADGQTDDQDSQKSAASKAAREALSANDSDLLEDVSRIVGRELEDQNQNRHVDDDAYIARDRSDQPYRYKADMVLIDEHRARKATNALRSRLEGLIQASKHQRTPPKRSGRRIDSRELVRLVRKDLRVFRARAEQTAVNTAVHILMDRSGSMNQMIHTAAEAMYATAMSLESIKDVSLETAVFPVNDKDVATLTRFGDKVRLQDYGIYARGGTPLTPALRHVAYRLMQQPEPRKICLVVTDGAPDEPSQAMALAKRMADAGIEVFGVGIGDMDWPGMFQRHCVIDHVQELPKALFGLLEQPLTAQSA